VTSLAVYGFWEFWVLFLGGIVIGSIADFFGLNIAIQLVAFLAFSGISILVAMKASTRRQG
jgi:membrane protein implicated in regulation of membrane protease activity